MDNEQQTEAGKLARERLSRFRFQVPKDRAQQRDGQKNAFSLTSEIKAPAKTADYVTVKTGLHQRLLDLLNEPRYVGASD